jgi:MYXO-CTERM domain-containing protein
VTDGANTLYSETFNARPVAWRQLVMTNSAAVSTASTASRGELGNFGMAINDPWIHQVSNGFVNATAANTDFIGPAIVVNDPGSAAFSDYAMRVRIGATDNDGLGVLVRVQDDNNFYRINFTNEVIGAGVTRAPRGLSVQKVRNGVWSELFRDNQDTPTFVYTPGAAGGNPDTASFPMFDLQVRAIGNTLKIDGIDHLGVPFSYPLIIDANDPLLTGSVGLQTWGTENVFYMGYAGAATPLLVEIPEPATGVLALAALVGVAAWRRRRA